MASEHSTSNDGTLGKICTKCRLWYPIDKFHKNKSKYDGLSYWCKDCDKHYTQSEQCKINYKKHMQAKKGKATRDKAQKKYMISEKGRIAYAKAQAKFRGLGWNLVYGNLISEPYCWHHISYSNVVAIPRDLHNLYNHNLLGINGHRFMLNQIIEQIYEIGEIE